MLSVADCAHNSFRQQTLPSSAPGDVKRLTPILLLPRSYLPLSILDPVPVSTAAPTARLFSAYIGALEYDGPDNARALVMVAKLEIEGSLYAIERVRCGLYALCRLGSWVNIEELRTAALASKNYTPPIMHNPLDVFGEKTWWEGAAIGPGDADEGLRAKRLKANSSDSITLKMRLPVSQTLPQCGRNAVPHEPEALTAAPVLSTPKSCEQPDGAEVKPEELFDTVRCQYLEALYLSKVSRPISNYPWIRPLTRVIDLLSLLCEGTTITGAGKFPGGAEGSNGHIRPCGLSTFQCTHPRSL